jgi:hypothetical protein
MSTPEKRGRQSPERRFARLLLGSMSADAPRPGAKRATLAALGLGTAAVATTGTAGALGVGGLVKLAATGALCGFATGGAALGIRHALADDPPDRPHSAVAGAPAAQAPLERRVPESPPAPRPSASSGEEATQPARSGAPPLRLDPQAPEPRENAGTRSLEDRTTGKHSPAVAVFEATPAPASSLREETVLLDRARAVIVAGDPGAGLVALDRYTATFPRGALAPEAALLRIKALVMSGDRSRARALARSFMAARPRDPHIEELRSLLEP